jgi:uncharacterized protein DUF4375
LDFERQLSEIVNIMSQLPFLQKYEGQTIDEIIALRGHYRDDSLVLAIENALIEREGWFDLDSERKERVILSLTEAERVVMAIEAMEREVNNGGYGQFFMNSSKHFAPYIVHALQTIGCFECAALMTSAIAELKLPPEYDGEDCDKALSSSRDEISPKLHELDERYYQNIEPLGDKLFSYIEQHASEIRIPRFS